MPHLIQTRLSSGQLSIVQCVQMRESKVLAFGKGEKGNRKEGTDEEVGGLSCKRLWVTFEPGLEGMTRCGWWGTEAAGAVRGTSLESRF